MYLDHLLKLFLRHHEEGISKDMLQKTTERRNDKLMETRFVYDELNRPINTLVKVNEQAELVVMSNNYDSYPDGQVGFTSRSFYSVDGTLPAIQTDKIKLKGLKISSWVLATKTDGTYNEGKQLGTTVYFDTKNRTVQTITKNYHGGNEISATDLDFIGRPRAEFTKASIQGKSVTTKTRNGYSYGGRKTAICQKIDADNYSEKWQPIATYNYNEIREMTEKILGCRTQVVDYEYNIKGWLTKINNPASLKVAATKEFDFFGIELTYSGDGNIKTQKYANAQRKYTTNSYNDVYDIESKSYDYSFGYDTQKRLTSANMAGSGKSFDLAMGPYDSNGNITTLQRTVNGTLVDNLEYKYNGTNLLNEVKEHAINRYFKGNSTYTYYSDGSLKNDSQKGITITYTANTLPAKILGGTNGYGYIYDATGRKLQTKVGTDTYDYAGNVVYLTKSGTTSIEFVGTPEGRWIPKEGLKTYNANKTENSTPAKYGRFEYILKDHLGNSRVACRCVEKPTATTTTDQAYLPVETQTNHYDPWGVSLNDDILPVALLVPLPSINKPQNRFTYNGKELQQDIGLHEYGFRWYDPMIARFTSVDPLATKFPWWTTYQYASSNPVNSIDLDGLESVNVATGKVDFTLSGSNLSQIQNSTNTNPWNDLRFDIPKNYFITANLRGNSVSPQLSKNAKGSETNFDYYSTVLTLPANMSMEQVFDRIRSNFASFKKGAEATEKFEASKSSEQLLFNSENPNTSIMRFVVNPGFPINLITKEGMAVITSNYQKDENSMSWVFSPVYSDQNGDYGHPLWGNRQFGITNNKNGTYTFFTRGIDKPYGYIDAKLQDKIFEGANQLWPNVIGNVSDYVRRIGGTAVIQPFIQFTK